MSLGKGEKIAIKFENPGAMKSLKHETKILNYLYSNKVRQIPAIYWYGLHGILPCLVMTYYEYSLAKYIEKKGISQLPKIMEAILSILSNIHKQFVLHRDIKPENFMIGPGGELILIDFGLATFYIGEDGQHVPDEECKTIIGSPRYMSIHILEGHRYSRRDDLISIGYIFAGFYLGHTHWEPEQRQIQCPINEDPLLIHNQVNIWRKQNRQIDMFRKWLPEGNWILQFLEEVYAYEYMDIPKYMISHDSSIV